MSFCLAACFNIPKGEVGEPNARNVFCSYFLWQPIFLDNNMLMEQLSSYLQNHGPLKTFNKKINGGHLKKRAYQKLEFQGHLYSKSVRCLEMLLVEGDYLFEQKYSSLHTALFLHSSCGAPSSGHHPLQRIGSHLQEHGSCLCVSYRGWDTLPKVGQLKETGALLDTKVQGLNHHALLVFGDSTDKLETSFYWANCQIEVTQLESKGSYFLRILSLLKGPSF